MTTKTIKIHNKEYQVNCYEQDSKTIVELPEELKKLDGYGTAIKPAFEPIVLCRKPLEKGGYVNNALKYGTSGLNIDRGRIESETIRTIQGQSNNQQNGLMYSGKDQRNKQIFENNIGRFPANFGLICTCEQEPCECVESELNEQSGISKSVASDYDYSESVNNNPSRLTKNIKSGIHFSDKGGASRFFYTAKASSKERELGLNELPKELFGHYAQDEWTKNNMGDTPQNQLNPRSNNHPTVKPIKLIEYLATLLLPPIENSSILIPFSGVGSEMIGSYFAGWQNITGIEIDEHYCEIANKRLDYWTQFEDYESAMKNKINPQTSYEDTLVAK